MKLKALNNWIFVTPIKDKLGLEALNQISKEKPSKAKVISVGNGEKAKLLNLKYGDIILLRKYGLDEFEVDGQKYYCLLADEVFAKVDESK